MIKFIRQPLLIVVLGIVMPSIILSSCAGSRMDNVSHTMNGIDIDSYEFLDGRMSQYMEGVYMERTKGSLVTDATTRYTGWDIYYEPDNRIFGIYAKARKNHRNGIIDARVHFSAAPQQYSHSTESWDSTPIGPAEAFIQTHNEYVKVDYLGRTMEQDGIVHFEFDEFSILLSQNLISEIRAGNPDHASDYIGPALAITLHREGYDDLNFKISQSEILAALYAIDLGFSCANSARHEKSFLCKASPPDSPLN